MNCEEMEVQLVDQLEGRPLEAQATQHLETCPKCRSWTGAVQGLYTSDSEIESRVPAAPVLITQDLAATRRAGRWFKGVAFIAVSMYVVAAVKVPSLRDRPLFALPFGVFGVSLLKYGLRLGGLPKTLGTGLMAAALALFSLYVVVSSPNSSPHFFSSLMDFRAGMPCFAGAFAFMVPIIGVLLWALRGVSLPAVHAGAVLGTGVGLVAAGLETGCPNRMAGHLLSYHGGPIMLTALAGAGVAAFITHRSFLRRAPDPPR